MRTVENPPESRTSDAGIAVAAYLHRRICVLCIVSITELRNQM